MNAKPTPVLFAAVVLSTLATVLASSAQARIPEGNGTQPPSRTAVNEQQASQGTEVLEPRLARHRTVVNQQQASQGTEVLEPRLARQGSGTFTVDNKICANLDRAIRVAIQQCLSHPVPLAANVVRASTGQQMFAHRFPAGYRGLP